MDTLKFHCTSSAAQLHPQRSPTAPPAHLNCTSSTPGTPTAPSARLNCTSSAPQLHLQCTPTAPPAHPNLIYIFAPAPPAHPNCTSQHHSLYKSMFSQKIRSAPLSTSEVHPTPGALRTSQHLCSSSEGYIFDQNFLSQGYQIENRSCTPLSKFFRSTPSPGLSDIIFRFHRR